MAYLKSRINSMDSANFYIQFKKQEREGWYTVSKTVIRFMIIFKYEPEENKAEGI